ncbi:Emp24/gp25L/p24 family protein [Ancylostoma caninum]|uniref:Emp24/gp25L/p24 family protein n=1 Tax=Ancylostoma caninum TaxID=29170 RepID=A0A368F6L1_ANCCA|nr:Emp24/gp25L/p24 family protein [Ancylostoma caninum]
MPLNRGDVVSWWVSGNRNFGFGLFLARSEDDNDFAVMDQIVPTFPWMPGPIVTPLEESIEIEEEGIYKFWISNERSWWSTVSVQIHIEVTGQGEDVTESK